MAKESSHRANELKEAGWSVDEVNRYAELWEYRQRWGAINLEREDRQFLRKAEAALPKLQAGKPSTKKLLVEKSYYRWLRFFLEAMDQAEEKFALAEGYRGKWPILLEEELRLIDHYQPVLGLPDTLKAKKFDNFREQIINQENNLKDEKMDLYTFDFSEPIRLLKVRESTKWRDLREVEHQKDNYPVLPPDSVVIFRKMVRLELLPLFKSTLPSLSETDKPDPNID